MTMNAGLPGLIVRLDVGASDDHRHLPIHRDGSTEASWNAVMIDKAALPCGH
jgi:hypothetical protein